MINKVKRLIVLGGSGFIGQHVLRRLIEDGYRVTALVRSESSFKRIDSFSVETKTVDHTNAKDLANCFEGHDAVINLVGILHETSSSTFKAVHEELPKKILQQCQASQVPQYVHMSALPADSELGPSRYLYSRGRGEDVVHSQDPRVAVTSLRPSLVFGPGDHFFSSFKSILRWMPILPLACPNARFAPVFVGDVAEAIVRVVADPQEFLNKRIDLCGPASYSFRELIDLLIKAMNCRRLIIEMPDALAKIQALILGSLPTKIFTTDNYLSLQVDSVSSNNGIFELGITPTSLEQVIEQLV